MMNQVLDDIYTTDKGELSIMPSLEVILRFFSLENAVCSITTLFQVLYKNYVIQLYNKKYHIILSNNYNDICFEQNINLEEIMQMEQAFKSCINLPIRKKTTLLTIFCHDERTKNNTEMFRLACSQSFFLTTLLY